MIHGVVVLLARAGAVTDPAPFAQAAADALYSVDDWLWLSDAIRNYSSSRRRGWEPEWFPLVRTLDGPDAPEQASAREACRLLAEAAKVPCNGDEDWTECAELIEQATARARAAVGNGS